MWTSSTIAAVTEVLCMTFRGMPHKDMRMCTTSIFEPKVSGQCQPDEFTGASHGLLFYLEIVVLCNCLSEIIQVTGTQLLCAQDMVFKVLQKPNLIRCIHQPVPF